MAYGVILGQNSSTAENVTYNNQTTSSIIKSDNVQGAIDELFTSVGNGKAQVAKAITDKGVSTSNNATFATMAGNIRKIATGLAIDENTSPVYYTSPAQLPKDAKMLTWEDVSSSGSNRAHIFIKGKSRWYRVMTNRILEVSSNDIIVANSSTFSARLFLDTMYLSSAQNNASLYVYR